MTKITGDEADEAYEDRIEKLAITHADYIQAGIAECEKRIVEAIAEKKQQASAFLANDESSLVDEVRCKKVYDELRSRKFYVDYETKWTGVVVFDISW